MKKTLLITLEFPPQNGGVANYLANLSANLSRDLIVVLTDKTLESTNFDQSQDYRIIREKLAYTYFWPKWLKTYFIAKKIIKKEGIEQIIISHVLPMGYIALLLRLPYLVSFHGYDLLAATNHPWKKIWLKIILSKAKHLIVNSTFTKKQLAQFDIKDSKITTIYPCPNISCQKINESEKQNISKELGLENKKILLSVGRLVERKGFDKVISALPEVIRHFPNLVYIVIGKGIYKKRLEDLAQKYNVLNHITILEDIPNSKLVSYYDLADIFIMPSRQIGQNDVEGFGIVYLEANSFAKPVIAGKSGGAGEAVLDNETGLLIHPENIQEISIAIIKLLSDQNMANKLGIQGKTRVQKEFTWPVQIKKIEHIL